MSASAAGADPRAQEGSSGSPTRIAVVIDTVSPFMRPLWVRLAQRTDIDLLLVTETPMERDRRWRFETDLPVEHVQLESWTLNLARLVVGMDYKRRFDSYVYVPKRPLAPLRRFSPHVVVAAGGGVWASRQTSPLSPPDAVTAGRSCRGGTRSRRSDAVCPGVSRNRGSDSSSGPAMLGSQVGQDMPVTSSVSARTPTARLSRATALGPRRDSAAHQAQVAAGRVPAAGRAP